MIAFITPRSLVTAIDVKCAIKHFIDLPTLNSTFLLIKTAYADIIRSNLVTAPHPNQISIVFYSTVKGGDHNPQLPILRPHHPIYYYKLIPSTTSLLLELTKNPPIQTHLTKNNREKKVKNFILYEH
jgi:hypothetical protein